MFGMHSTKPASFIAPDCGIDCVGLFDYGNLIRDSVLHCDVEPGHTRVVVDTGAVGSMSPQDETSGPFTTAAALQMLCAEAAAMCGLCAGFTYAAEAGYPSRTC